LIHFVIQLLAVFHILPFTASTNTKVLTNRFCTMFWIFENALLSFVKGLALLNVCTSTITWNHVRDKHYFAIRAFATDTPFAPASGLLSDERQLCLYFS
jgi:hypothetical protein